MRGSNSLTHCVEMGLYLKQCRDELLVDESKGRLTATAIELLLNIEKRNPNNAIKLNDILKGVYLVLIFGHLFSVICFIIEFLRTSRLKR